MSIIKGLFQDIDSLHEYHFDEIKEVSIDVLERRLRLIERDKRPELTDHYFLHQSRKEIEEIKKNSQNTGKFILNCTTALSVEFLEERNGLVYVKQEKFLDWQELICFFPPLLLIAAYVFEKHGCITDLDAYLRKHIIPNVLYTALPAPYIPELEHLLVEKRGLHDLHIHLNGTMESDWVWADMMVFPSESLKEVHKNFDGDEMIKEHFSQVDPRMNSTELDRLLEKAHKHRQEFYKDFLMNVSDAPLCNSRGDISIREPSLVTEMLIYIWLFTNIRTDKQDYSGRFHHYLLSRGLINMLLVHQPCQFGFRQFQKITKNELRWYSERSFNRRFFQLSGNRLMNIKNIEGRFSPKKSLNDNSTLLHNIEQGWTTFIQNVGKQTAKKKPKLHLVAHFIKKPKGGGQDMFRHETLRNELRTIAESLCSLKKQGYPNTDKLVGIDAAASEFDAPPEVFAPVYRYLRENEFNNFTYHAGEDFTHIVSGLRAIYEAVAFLGLERGDRIGHCVASGSDASLWLKGLRGEICISQGEYLSDCIFAYHLISKEKDPIKELHHLIPNLILRIEQLSEAIYGECHSISNLVTAWEYRKWCPMAIRKLYLNLDLGHDDTDAFTIKDEWDKLPEKIRKIIFQHNDNSDNIITNQQNKTISIDPAEIFNEKVITRLQKELLNYMHKREIVIETLPTSNLRIGFYDDFSSSHIWNWLQWKSEGCPVPPIVVGTDDAGIFATNIYNEYANLYCFMVHKKNLCHKDAMKLLREFDENADIYHFR